jgi:hypothetical protein
MVKKITLKELGHNGNAKKILQLIIDKNNIYNNRLKRYCCKESYDIDLSKFVVSVFPDKLISTWLPFLKNANFSGFHLDNLYFLNNLKKLEKLIIAK